MKNDINQEWVLWELKQGLRALASPGQVALATQPAGTVKADELALIYCDFLAAALGEIHELFTKEQRDALTAVDGALDAMSGQANAALWTEEAVIGHPAWDNVRGLATSALALLGWAGEPLSWEQYIQTRRTGVYNMRMQPAAHKHGE